MKMSKMEDKKEEAKKERDHEKRAAGGAVGRKKGGMIPGKMAAGRMDRRARGGACSDGNPLSSAGKMSKPSYETAAKSTVDEGRD